MLQAVLASLQAEPGVQVFYTPIYHDGGQAAGIIITGARLGEDGGLVANE